MTAEPEPETTIVYRDNTPVVLVPECPGTSVIGNELVSIDITNASEGYIGVHYKGSNVKVKFQIKGPDGVTYTYDLVIGVDADEFIIVDPKCGRSLLEYLDEAEIGTSLSALGLDFGQNMA